MERRGIGDRVASRQGGSLRFSLASMFIVTTGVAIVLSGIYAGSDWTAKLTAMLCIVLGPIVLTVWLVDGRGYARTFAIGGLFPAALFMLSVLLDLLYAPNPYFGRMGNSTVANDVSNNIMVLLAVYCSAIITTGLLAMGVRWMVESRDGVPSSQSSSGIDFGKSPLDQEDGASDVETEDSGA